MTKGKILGDIHQIDKDVELCSARTATATGRQDAPSTSWTLLSGAD